MIATKFDYSKSSEGHVTMVVADTGKTVATFFDLYSDLIREDYKTIGVKRVDIYHTPGVEDILIHGTEEEKRAEVERIYKHNHISWAVDQFEGYSDRVDGEWLEDILEGTTWILEGEFEYFVLWRNELAGLLSEQLTMKWHYTDWILRETFGPWVAFVIWLSRVIDTEDGVGDSLEILAKALTIVFGQAEFWYEWLEPRVGSITLEMK